LSVHFRKAIEGTLRKLGDFVEDVVKLLSIGHLVVDDLCKLRVGDRATQECVNEVTANVGTSVGEAGLPALRYQGYFVFEEIKYKKSFAILIPIKKPRHSSARNNPWLWSNVVKGTDANHLDSSNASTTIYRRRSSQFTNIKNRPYFDKVIRVEAARNGLGDEEIHATCAIAQCDASVVVNLVVHGQAIASPEMGSHLRAKDCCGQYWLHKEHDVHHVECRVVWQQSRQVES